MLGYEVIIDTLLLSKADYLLSSGHGNIASGSNITLAAQILKEDKFEKLVILNTNPPYPRELLALKEQILDVSALRDREEKLRNKLAIQQAQTVNATATVAAMGAKKMAAVLGNGPSLRGFDFEKSLQHFDTFGMNAAYRYWDQINWYPDYYSCLDVVVGMAHKDEIMRLIKRSDKYGIKNFLLRDNLVAELGLKSHPKVTNFDSVKNTRAPFIGMPRVTTGSHTLAWAASLGYRNIALLGIDANYVEIIDGFKVDIFDTKKLYQIIQENKPLAKAKSKKYWRIIIEFKYNANNYIYFDGKYLELFIKFLNEFTTSAIYIIPEKNQMFAQDSVGNKCLLMSINKNGINTNHLVIKFY